MSQLISTIYIYIYIICVCVCVPSLPPPSLLSQVPIMVALNKTDHPEATPERYVSVCECVCVRERHRDRDRDRDRDRVASAV